MTKVFEYLSRSGREDQVVTLPDGTRLEPRSRVHTMYCVLIGTVEESILTTEQDVVDLHANLLRNVETLCTEPGLSNAWCIMYDSLGGRDNLTQHECERNVLVLGTFRTIEGLMRIWRELPIDNLGSGATLRIFKEGISPTRDDAPNVEGGRWSTHAPCSVRISPVFLVLFVSTPPPPSTLTTTHTQTHTTRNRSVPTSG